MGGGGARLFASSGIGGGCRGFSNLSVGTVLGGDEAALSYAYGASCITTLFGDWRRPNFVQTPSSA